MVDLLRELIQRRRKDIDAFVFPLLATGDSDKKCIIRHYSTQLLSRDAA